MTLHNRMTIFALGAALWLFTSVSIADPVSIKNLPFEKGNLPKNLPKSLQLSGRIAGGARWLDKLGENILVVTENVAKSSAFQKTGGLDGDFHGYHFVNRGGSWAQVWKKQDVERDCPIFFSAYLPETLTITDLDADGVAEIVFLYRFGCSRTDLSPSGFQLTMHEGADDAFTIRSETIQTARGTLEAKMNPDPTFARAPASFKAYAIQQWQKHGMDNQ